MSQEDLVEDNLDTETEDVNEETDSIIEDNVNETNPIDIQENDLIEESSDIPQSDGLPTEIDYLDNVVRNLYTTLYDEEHNVVDTNDEDVRSQLGPDYNYGTVDKEAGLYVYFRLANINNSSKEKGIREGVTYIMELPDDLIPQNNDEENLINPKIPMDFFQDTGGITAKGGIYHDDNRDKYTLKIAFNNVDNYIDVSGGFQYGVKINAKYQPGDKVEVDFGLLGGTLSFDITPDPSEEPVGDYTLKTKVIQSEGNPSLYTHEIHIKNNTGNYNEFAYKTLDVTLGEGLWFPAVTSGSISKFYSNLNLTIVYGDDEKVSIPSAYPNMSQNNSLGFGSYDDRHCISMSFQFSAENSIYKLSDTFALVPKLTIYIGAYSGTSTQIPSGYATNIKEIIISIPTEIYDDYKYNGEDEQNYTITSILGSAKDQNLLKKEDNITVDYKWNDNLQLYDKPSRDSSLNYSYPDYIESTIKVSNNTYNGNYYWLEFDPAVLNKLNTNYYMQHCAFSVASSHQLVGSDGQGSFDIFRLRNKQSDTIAEDWTFIGFLTVENLKNKSFSGVSIDDYSDIKFKYQLTEVFKDVKDNSDYLMMYKSSKVLPSTNKYAYLVIDPNTLQNNSQGWTQFISANNKGMSVNSYDAAKPPKWRMHIFNAPETILEANFRQYIGSFNADDQTTKGEITDFLRIGNASKESYLTETSNVYGFERPQVAYMNGTWLSDDIIFWKFVVNMKDYPLNPVDSNRKTQAESIFYIQPDNNQSVNMSNSGGHAANGLPSATLGLWCDLPSTSHNWSPLMGNNPARDYSSYGVDYRQISEKFTLNPSNGNIFSWKPVSYNILNSGKRDSNGNVTFGFFTKVNSAENSINEYTCNAEIVLNTGDITLPEYRKKQQGVDSYPIKIKASGSIPALTLGKFQTSIENTQNGSDITTQWDLNFSNVSTAKSGRTTTKKLFDDYTGWYSGDLIVSDSMQKSKATDSNDIDSTVNPAEYTHITRMFERGIQLKYADDSEAVLGEIPYDNGTGSLDGMDPVWQKYDYSPGTYNWNYMNSSEYLWDSDKPGFYKRTYTTGFKDPIEIYVIYSGNMKSSIYDITGDTGGAIYQVFPQSFTGTFISDTLKEPVLIVYRHLKYVSSISPITYTTNFNSQAFIQAALEAQSNQSEEIKNASSFNISLKNDANFNNWINNTNIAASSTVERKVAAAIAIEKEAEKLTGKGYSGDYTLKVTNGVSDTSYIKINDYISGFSNSQEALRTTREDLEEIARYLDFSNVTISIENPQSSEPEIIYQNREFITGWNETSSIVHEGTEPGSVFTLTLQRDDAIPIPAGTVFKISYTMTLDMDGKAGSDGFRNSSRYSGGYLRIENRAQASRPYSQVSSISTLGIEDVSREQTEDGVLTVDCGGNVGLEYLLGTQLTKKKGSESNNGSHTEWLFSLWTGSKGKNNLEVTLSDRIGYIFTGASYTDNETGETVYVDKLENKKEKDKILTHLEFLLEKHSTYSNIKIYYQDTKPENVEDLAEIEPLWDLGDFSFTGDSPTQTRRYNASGIDLTLVSSPATFNNLGDIAVHKHAGFEVKAKYLDCEKYFSSTYDIDIDWEAFLREASEVYKNFDFTNYRLRNIASDGTGPDQEVSSEEAQIDSIQVIKQLDQLYEDGTASWSISASTGSINDSVLKIHDNLNIRLPEEGEDRIKTAALAATSIDPDSVVITQGDTIIYQNGESLDNYSSNIKVLINDLSLEIIIENTTDSQVLEANQTYYVTYNTVFNALEFLKNGGSAEDEYILSNSALLEYGNFHVSSTTENDFTPDLTVEADKTVDGPHATRNSWTVNAKTRFADREDFKLSDEIIVKDNQKAQEALMITAMSITVSDSNGSQDYTPETLPENIVLTDQAERPFELNKSGVFGFKLIFLDILPAGTMITVNYITDIDTGLYSENGEILLENNFEVSDKFGNTSSVQKDTTVEIQEPMEKTGVKLEDQTSKEGYPLIEWTFNINLYTLFTQQELEELTTITITDELSPILRLVQGSVNILYEGNSEPEPADVSEFDNKVVINVDHPSLHPKFTLTFRTECLTSVDGLVNRATLSIDGKIVDESTSNDPGRVVVSGVSGFIRSVEAPTFTPTAVKYLDHELCTDPGAFTFEIIEVDSGLSPIPGGYTDVKTNGADGKVEFKEIKYPGVEKNYYYQIKEINTESEDYYYDQTIFLVCVEVVKVSDGYVVSQSIHNPISYTEVRFDNLTYFEEITTNITVTKEWIDNNNEAMLRPGAITVELYQNGQSYHSSATLSEANGWTHTWENLPIAGGEYSVVETEVLGYTGETRIEDGITILTNTINVGSLAIRKTVSGDQSDPEHEFTFTVLLKDRDGKELEESFNYTGSKTGMIKSGEKIKLKNREYILIKNLPDGTQYEVTEEEANKNGYTTTATDNQGAIQAGKNSSARFVNQKGEDITGTAELVINKAVTGNRGETDRDFNFQISLSDKDGRALTDSYPYSGSRSGIVRDGDTIQLKHNESVTVSGLPEGTQYSVQELEANKEGYTTNANGASGTATGTSQSTASFVNDRSEDQQIPATTSLSVSKVWVDGSNANRPGAISVQLYRSGSAYGSVVSLSQSNNWRYTWTGLSTDYTWSVQEVSVPAGYKSIVSYSGTNWVITNIQETTEIPTTTQVSVKKVWEDNNSSERPESIDIQLYRNGTAYGNAVSLSKTNNWSYLWTGLSPSYSWSVQEVRVPDGYSMKSSNIGNNWTIINTKDTTVETPEDVPNTEVRTTSLSVNKVWDDNNNPERPDSVTVQLYRNAKAYGNAITLDNLNNWQYTWTELDIGYTWSVQEINVSDDYNVTTSNSDNATRWTITNRKKDVIKTVVENPAIPNSPAETVNSTQTDNTAKPGTVYVSKISTVTDSPQTGVVSGFVLLPWIGLTVGGCLLERNYRRKRSHKDDKED